MSNIIVNKKMPQILSLAISRVEEWSKRTWKWLPRLRSVVFIRIQRSHRKSSRKIRIEQRVAITKVLQVILQYLDLNSLCVGLPDKETNIFIHLTLDYIARKSGLPLRRAQRAMNWLYESGYITPYRQSSYDIDNNIYLHKPSIRKVNPKLLLDLGITSLALQKARINSKRHLESIILKNLSTHALGGVSNKNDKIKNIINTFVSSFSTSNSKKIIHPPPEYLEKIKKILREFPNLTYNEAQRLLPPL